ncbi:MAG: V4R domain-containing protein [Candidatus Heimdallarchaeota archaeon]
MIDEFFILRKDGLTLFHIILDEESFTVQVPTDLFAGFSSAIVAFANELGSGQLSKIEIEDQIYVYDVQEDLITVAKICSTDDEATAEHIVTILEREFLKDYKEELKDYDGTVRKDVFFPFSVKVRSIVSKCMKIAKKNPHLLANIPTSIDIDAIVKLSDYSDELVDNFPESTIALTREFQEQIPDDIMHYTMFRLGKEFGRDIAKKKIKKVNDKAIKKLLKEISICSFDNNIITLKICPFCRGRETKIFDCDFVAGFIEGAYNDPNISVREIKCHAVGDKFCEFRVYKN